MGKNTIKVLVTVLALLILSLAANYALEYLFWLPGSEEADFLETLFWSSVILIIPFLLSGAVALYYKVFKARSFRYFWQTVWVSWLIIYTIPFAGMYAIQT